LVVHGSDGLDEITITGETYAYRVHGGVIEELLINPHLLGCNLATREDLLGGDAAANAVIVREVLSGKLEGPKADIVLLNAGAAIHVADLAPTLAEGIALARMSISSGAALACLHKLQALSREYHPTTEQ